MPIRWAGALFLGGQGERVGESTGVPRRPEPSPRPWPRVGPALGCASVTCVEVLGLAGRPHGERLRLARPLRLQEHGGDGVEAAAAGQRDQQVQQQLFAVFEDLGPVVVQTWNETQRVLPHTRLELAGTRRMAKLRESLGGEGQGGGFSL